jgi:hypothetical protein
MGLGRHLMRRLVRWARGRRLERLYGDVLEHNQPMLALAQSLGFRRESADDPGLVRVVLELGSGARDGADQRFAGRQWFRRDQGEFAARVGSHQALGHFRREFLHRVREALPDLVGFQQREALP